MDERKPLVASSARPYRIRVKERVHGVHGLTLAEVLSVGQPLDHLPQIHGGTRHPPPAPRAAAQQGFYTRSLFSST